jgi:hypothetical protein
MKTSIKSNITSPWLDQRLENLFRTELEISLEKAEDPMNSLGYKSLPAFDWIQKNGAQDLLYKGLTQCAPLYPVIAYRGQTIIWMTPSPIIAGKALLLIMGKDLKGRIRLIGSNNTSIPKSYKAFNDLNIFEAYDQSISTRQIERLIYNVISSKMSIDDLEIASQVEYESQLFRVMPIALLILDGEMSYMAFAPAIVYGNHISDMSKEFIGEVL